MHEENSPATGDYPSVPFWSDSTPASQTEVFELNGWKMPEENERERLAKDIRHWNENRLNLFEISQPDENLEFHGVMRFHFEDGGGNVATKCLRVCSSSSTHEVIETLSEKFRPDMKMLSSDYSLYEIHGSTECKLDLDKRPLVVQLSWTADNREGRFVLKKDKKNVEENRAEKEKGGMIQNFKRTLSRKEKKKEKGKTPAGNQVSQDENGSTEKPLNSSSTSDQETKGQCRENKRQQRQPAPGEKYTGSSYSSPGLPLGIQFCDNNQDALLSAVINYTQSSTIHFKLSPAYILYATARFALHRQRSPHMQSVTSLLNKTAAMMARVIQRQQELAGALAFWMANSSELLNFLKQDKDLNPLTLQSQLELSHLVHKAYSCLLQCLQKELRRHLPTFLIDPERHGSLPAGIEMVLNTLMNTMSLLRRCRVNPAFTIQLFSQLFHFVSAWLFNRLMTPDADAPGLRSHYWGAALRQRLMAIEAWAERQGLELAADCHLGHIIQATMLLTMNKYSMKDAKDIQNTCFKLNSLQLQTLLSGYLYATSEPHVPPDLIDAVVKAAQNSADHLIQSEGRDIRLEESLDLHLPFLLPEGGYSCDAMRGIPPGLREFVEPISWKGLCSLISQRDSRGDWTVFFSEPASSAESRHLTSHREPEVVTITLNKPLNSGMGVSIVAAKGAGQGSLGIYIKSIVRGGPAEMNGRLTAGDQLLSVDGQSLVGLSQERAAAIMMQTGPVVTLQVAKLGASYHGLGALLSERTSDGVTGEESLASNSIVDPGASELLHGSSSRRRKDQLMQRNRQLYRSNPNMSTDFAPEEGEEPADAVVRGNMAAVSSVNLCADTFHREYLTLPNPKSQDKTLSKSTQPQPAFTVSLKPLGGHNSSKRSIMRQAVSQENLCTDSGASLVDKRQDQQAWQTMSTFSSFPIRLSVSTHDILSDNHSSTKPQQCSRTSGAGVWRTPFSQHPTPTPSIQPIRIDIPVTRAVTAQTNPPLTTFQSSSLLAAKRSQTLLLNGTKQGPPNQANHIYACPILATKKLPQPSQQSRSYTNRGHTTKSYTSTTPTKHVSFQEPPANLQQERQTQQRELGDPWKREAQEKLQKQQRLQAVELLEQEVQELQAKARRTAEESDRLRKLSLEWQFQKRLQEIQQRGEEEEEEEEDLEMMLTIQQLEKRTQNRRNSAGNLNIELEEKHRGSHLSQKEDEAKKDQRPSRLMQDIDSMALQKCQEENIKRALAPEKLPFKERQRLFSLPSSA